MCVLKKELYTESQKQFKVTFILQTIYYNYKALHVFT